jgi:hypothetical protein
MAEDYKKWIVSDNLNVTFLHRCFRDSVDQILREGVSSWYEDLSGTATIQPRDLRDAEQLYKNGRDHGDSVIVIQFPKELYRKYARRGSNLTNRALAYFHPTKQQFTVRPIFVTAHINRETNEVHLNPYVDRKPPIGHEKLDFMFD